MQTDVTRNLQLNISKIEYFAYFYNIWSCNHIFSPETANFGKAITFQFLTGLS